MTSDTGKRPAEEPAGGLPRPRRGRAVNVELRGLAVAAVMEGGMSAAAAARHFGLGKTTVVRWVAQFRERGHLRPGGQRRRGVSPIEAERERIFRILEARPLLSIRELCDALAAEGFAFGRSSVHRFLQRHRLERDRRLGRLRRRNRSWVRGGERGARSPA